MSSNVRSFKNKIHVFRRLSFINRWIIWKINQTIEIALRFLITTLKHSNRWFEILLIIRRDFNNVKNNTINHSFNEIAYDFIFVQSFDLKFFFTNLFFKNNRFIIRLNAANAIVFDQMNVKFHYDRKHQSLFMKKKTNTHSFDYTKITTYSSLSVVNTIKNTSSFSKSQKKSIF